MTSDPAGKPETPADTPPNGDVAPAINYADELAAEIVEIQSHVTPATKQEAAASFRDEKVELEYQRLKVEVRILQADLASKEADNQDRLTTTRLRGDYADKAYKLASGSIAFWVIIIGFEAIVRLVVPGDKVILSDPVLIAITTGCTVNVLAAFLGVIRGLFPSHSNSVKDKKVKKDKPRSE